MKKTVVKITSINALLLTGLVNAGEVVVNSPSDSGFGCTLREAVESINTETPVGGCAIEPSTGNNRILFSDSVNTITLREGQIEIKKPVEVDGGVVGVTIDADEESRIFTVSNDTGTTHLKSLTLTGGRSLSGGAILQTGRLSISNASFINNHASFGGAIFVGRSPGQVRTLLIENSRFRDNRATDIIGTGGAINFGVGGIITVQNSTFANNQAKRGGAIYVEDAPLFIENNVFDGNSGGAIRAKTSTSSISNSTFSNNAANPAIAIFSGDTTISNNTFYRNTYQSAGAIFAAPYSSSRYFIKLSNNTFWGNHSGYGGDGGAISLDYVTARADSNIFLSNTSGAGNALSTCGLVNGGNFQELSSNNIIDEGTSCGFNTTDDSLKNQSVADYRDVLANQTLLPPISTNVVVLADNGCQVKAGPTGFKVCPRTIALVDNPTNPAVNNGKAGIRETTDQRGFPFDGVPDVGAYELDRSYLNTGVIFKDSFESP